MILFDGAFHPGLATQPHPLRQLVKHVAEAWLIWKHSQGHDKGARVKFRTQAADENVLAID